MSSTVKGRITASIFFMRHTPSRRAEADVPRATLSRPILFSGGPLTSTPVADHLFTDRDALDGPSFAASQRRRGFPRLGLPSEATASTRSDRHHMVPSGLMLTESLA